MTHVRTQKESLEALELTFGVHEYRADGQGSRSCCDMHRQHEKVGMNCK